MALILKAWVGIVVGVTLVYAVRHLTLTVARLIRPQRPYYQDLFAAEPPPVTVLVPMHNEGLVAERVLRAIAASQFPPHLLEVIAIDDHSDDDTPDILARLQEEMPFLRVLRRDGRTRGKPAGLNEALALASHEIILIFDADYEPPAGALRELAMAFVDPEVGAVMGRVVPRNTRSGLLARLLDLERSGGYQVDQQARWTLDLIPQYGGTVGGFRRTVALEQGGFDPRVLAEDTDMTFRLYLRGWRVAYANRVECYEEVPQEWDARFRQLRRWARGHTQVMSRHLSSMARSPYLTRGQRVDGTLVLTIFMLPPLLLSGLVANTLLFLMGDMGISESVVLGLAVAGYNAFGNYAPFFQVGAAGLIDGMRERMRLLPLFFWVFVYNTLAVSLGVCDGILDGLRRERAPQWDKTARIGETV